ncbi:putative sodium/metabolite cotransporter BASS1 chloroplastic [Bienertia sinuspersici]
MMQSLISFPHRTPNVHPCSSSVKDLPSIVDRTHRFLSLSNKHLQWQTPISFTLRCQYDGFPTQSKNPISFATTHKRFLIHKPENEPNHFARLLCGNSSNRLSAANKSQVRKLIELSSEALSTAFPIWVALGCLMGLLKPNSFNWVKPQLSIMGLTITMLGMGMTLTLDDLSGAFSMPKQVIAGFLLQYSVMPLTGFFLSRLLGLPSPYAAGLILVGCCPGGE